jgi:hypothetical protein
MSTPIVKRSRATKTCLFFVCLIWEVSGLRFARADSCIVDCNTENVPRFFAGHGGGDLLDEVRGG